MEKKVNGRDLGGSGRDLIEIRYLQLFTIKTNLLANNFIYKAINFDPELRSSSDNDTR
jgi:hypothetical protein